MVQSRPLVLVLLTREISFHDSSKVHGSILWTASFLETLSQVPDIDFVIVSIGQRSAEKANHEFVSALGFDHSFVPFRAVELPVARDGCWPWILRMTVAAWGALSEKYYFIAERYYGAQKHLDAEIVKVIRDKHPDLIVINEISAAIGVPSIFSLKIPCCLVSVNNEVAFHRTYKSQGGPVGEAMRHKIERWIYRRGNWISNRRFRNYMQRVHKQCAGFVTLTHSDLPDDLPDDTVRAVIPPMLKENDLQWSYQGSRCLLFVGNIWIYSNRLAIEWICNNLAPEILRIDGTVRINIIGASTDKVPSGWSRPNTIFMGYASKKELSRQMITADLFIAPIANDYGAKLKVAECVSHATPFLATYAAMSGLPFRVSLPRIDLGQPAAVARLVLEYINDPEALTKLSRSIAEHAQRARNEQAMAWGGFLRRSMENVRKER